MANSLKQSVLSVLSQHPDCRDDDTLLLVSVWQRQGLSLTEDQKRCLSQLSKPGSIVRTRAHIQNDEKRFRPIRRFRS